MGGLGSSETLHFVHQLKLKLPNEPISKLLTAKDELIHLRLSNYIRDSFLILERKKKHPLVKKYILHKVLHLNWRETAYSITRTFGT